MPERTKDGAGQAARGESRLRRRYAATCAVLGALAAGGTIGCLARPTAWNAALAPLLGAGFAAFLWCAAARLWLCRNPERLLARDFARALRRSLAVPVWMAATVLLLSLLPDGSRGGDIELSLSLGILVVLLLLAAVPASVALGALAVHSAVRHLRAAPASEPPIYREGPLVLAVLLLAAETAALGWLAFYLLAA